MKIVRIGVMPGGSTLEIMQRFKRQQRRQRERQVMVQESVAAVLRMERELAKEVAHDYRLPACLFREKGA